MDNLRALALVRANKVLSAFHIYQSYLDVLSDVTELSGAISSLRESIDSAEVENCARSCKEINIRFFDVFEDAKIEFISCVNDWADNYPDDTWGKHGVYIGEEEAQKIKNAY